MFRKTLDFAEAGDNVGVLLRGVQRTEIQRGQVLAKPGTIHPHTKFRGQVYVLTKDEGGRHTRPVIVNTSSTGIRNGWSALRSGVGIYSSTASISSWMHLYSGALGSLDVLVRAR